MVGLASGVTCKRSDDYGVLSAECISETLLSSGREGDSAALAWGLLETQSDAEFEAPRQRLDGTRVTR